MLHSCINSSALKVEDPTRAHRGGHSRRPFLLGRTPPRSRQNLATVALRKSTIEKRGGRWSAAGSYIISKTMLL